MPFRSFHTDSSAPPLEFVLFGLTAKYQLTTALARLRERGDREAVGEGFADLERRKQPLTPGFAVPSPLGEGRYQPRPHCECKCRKLEGGGLQSLCENSTFRLGGSAKGHGFIRAESGPK